VKVNYNCRDENKKSNSPGIKQLDRRTANNTWTLTYHAGKLWNQANYLVKNRLAKPDYRDLYNKLKDTSLHHSGCVKNFV